MSYLILESGKGLVQSCSFCVYFRVKPSAQTVGQHSQCRALWLWELTISPGPVGPSSQKREGRRRYLRGTERQLWKFKRVTWWPKSCPRFLWVKIYYSNFLLFGVWGGESRYIFECLLFCHILCHGLSIYEKVGICSLPFSGKRDRNLEELSFSGL